MAKDLKVRITAQNETQAALSDVAKGIKTLEASTQSASGALTGLASAFGPGAGIAVGVGALAGAIGLVIRNSIDLQNAMAQVQVAVTSTGAAAGRSVGELTKLADALQQNTTFSKPVILTAESILLTFNKIKGVTFDRTLKDAADLATRFGLDLPQAAKLLGKALEDPATGMGVLRRAGVVLSASQRETIKDLAETGHVAQAQTELLRLLEIGFGGAASAATNTLGGALTQLKNTFNDTMTADSDSTKGLVDSIHQLNNALSGTFGWVSKIASFLVGDSFRPSKIAGLQAAAAARVAADVRPTTPPTTAPPEEPSKEDERARAEIARLRAQLSSTVGLNAAKAAGLGIEQNYRVALAGTEAVAKLAVGTNAALVETVRHAAEAVERAKLDEDLRTAALRRQEQALQDLKRAEEERLRAIKSTQQEGKYQIAAAADENERQIENVAKMNKAQFTQAMNDADAIAKMRGNQFGRTLSSAIAGGLSDLMSTIGDTLGKGGNVWKALGDALLVSLANVAKQVGEMLIQMGIQIEIATLSFNPLEMIAAGAALVAIGSAVSAAAQKTYAASGGYGGGGFYNAVASQTSAPINITFPEDGFVRTSDPKFQSFLASTVRQATNRKVLFNGKNGILTGAII